jgi:hypothetical protein
MSVVEKAAESIGNKVFNLHLEAKSNEVNHDLHIL